MLRKKTIDNFNKNLLFDQKIYDNVGKTIAEAHQKKLPIVIENNEFYPSTIMKQQEKLVLQAHHLYKVGDSIWCYTFNKGDLNRIVDSLHLQKYILLTKYKYSINKANDK